MNYLNAYDFEFDGLCLSTFDMTLCDFDTKDLQTVSSGAPVTFNQVKVFSGREERTTSASYDSVLETTIQICKNPCHNTQLEIPHDEYRELCNWLIRKQYLKFKVLNDQYLDLYFLVKFEVNKLELDGVILGLELHITTSHPYALQEMRTITIETTENDEEICVYNSSHEEGFLYPKMMIEIKQSGDLIICNDFDARAMEFKNCEDGEVLTVEYPVVTSTKDNIEFNWKFLRLYSEYQKGANNLTVSIPCRIQFSYSPIIKIGF